MSGLFHATDLVVPLTRQGNRLDWNYIVTELSLLKELKEDSDVLQHLETIRQEVEGGAK